MLKVGLCMVCQLNRLGMMAACLVVFAPTTVLLELAEADTVGLYGMLAGGLSVLAGLLSMAFWNGIMMVCPPTVLAGGFVQAAVEAAIPNTPINPNLNMAITIWRFSTVHAATTVFSARTGITATYPPNTSRS
jgi:hypothetical protein